jgi:hypothetical protein
MAYEQQVELLNRLSAKTKEGSLDWKKTADDNTLQVSFRKNSVQLQKTKLPTANPSYSVALLDGEGNVVEEFHDAELDQDKFGQTDQHFYELMAEMYERARRRAYGADKVLSEILKDLN